jgi:hypothetical protein
LKLKSPFGSIARHGVGPFLTHSAAFKRLHIIWEQRVKLFRNAYPAFGRCTVHWRRTGVDSSPSLRMPVLCAHSDLSRVLTSSPP